MRLHRLTLYILYLCTIATITYLVYAGYPYYSLALSERPHSALHDAYKPSGLIGHGLGIVGTLLMLALLLYSARKRLRIMQRWGNIRYWLNYHIWMGITGPLLVIFHTAFKLGGIVSVSFWSMIAVALSGVLGRYIYIQIPRSLSGHELSADDLAELDRELRRQLEQDHQFDDALLSRIDHAAGTAQSPTAGGLAGLVYWIRQDATLPFRLRAVRREIRRTSYLSHAEMATVVKIVRQTVKLRRRMAFLGTAHQLLHHWHVFHKPFAVIMLTIMVVHVTVAVLFGYTWLG